MVELDDFEICPCESGGQYVDCCKSTSLKWVVNDDGEVFKELPIPEDSHEYLKEMTSHYNDVFERDPIGSDPIFLGQYLQSTIDIQKQAVELLERADIAPEFIYAYQKTNGLMVVEDRLDLYTKKDLEDWDKAITEYFDLLENPPEQSEYSKLWASFQEEIENCIIALGYAIDNGSDSDLPSTPSTSSFFDIDSYVFLCASKSIKTLRAIRVLLKEDIGSDCLPLARHIYENFLHILIARNQPSMLEHIIDAVVGMKLGTHEYEKTKKDKINSRVIVRKSDGKKFKGHISTYSMAESSPHDVDAELFSYMYEFLSEYTHPSFTSLQLVLTEEGRIDTLSNELDEEASFLSICFSALILKEVADLTSVTKQVQVDLLTVVNRIAHKSIEIIDNFLDVESEREHFQLLKSRMSILLNGA